MTVPLAIYRYELAGEDDADGGTLVLGEDGFFAAVTPRGGFAFRIEAPFGQEGVRRFVVDMHAHYLRARLNPGRPRDDTRAMADFITDTFPRFKRLIDEQLDAEHERSLATERIARAAAKSSALDI